MNKNKLAEALLKLTDLVSKLRGPGGCPWDARQTTETIRMYLLEEAYEVVDAVENGSLDDLCGELGDLLFQILFLARLGEEKGSFDFVDVMEGITSKMIHRHPHVFGTKNVESAEEVADNWARLKRRETGRDGSLSFELRSVPSNLPALLRAQRLSQRAARASTNKLDVKPPTWKDAEGEVKGVRECLENEEAENAEEMLAKLLFDLAWLAGQNGWNAEDLLRKANRRFIRHVEEPECKALRS
jgi:MazG family protein